MTVDAEILKRLARESGETLGQLGLRADDRRWIEVHAETIASLARSRPRRRSLGGFLYRLARKAARTAR